MIRVFVLVSLILSLSFTTSAVAGELEQHTAKKAPASTEPGIIVVDQRTMDFLEGLGPEVVFFTSKEHPLERISNIINGDDEFAAWGPPPDITKLMQLGRMIGVAHLHMIGNGNFENLFIANPKLKLFVTGKAVYGVEAIDRNGGGVKIRFVSEDNLHDNVSQSPPSCAEECRSQYSKGEFKQGITIEDCIKATCK